jgi:hypothetical protein
MNIFILKYLFRKTATNMTITLFFQHKKSASTFFILCALFFTIDFQAQHNALDFDGVDDYVNIGNNLNLTSSISIEAWVKTDGLGSRQTILDKGYSSAGEPYYQYHVEVRSGGEVYFALSLGGTRKTTQTSTTLTAGQWHHIACVYNGSTIKIYIDGIEESSTNATGSISTYSTSLYIGAYSGPTSIGSFDGLIDEVRIWSDERTASEISTNKSIELNGNESNLVGYYKFNETSTNTVASNSASITGDSYDGALTNMTGSEWTTSTAFPDTTPPTISSVTANWGDFLTEVEDDVNGTVTVVTSGAEDGQTLTLTLNSVNYTASVSSNSASITVTAGGLQALSNNTDYTLTTNVSDLAGNSATTFTATTFKALNNPSSNNALAFDGTNDYVAANTNLPTGDFTYSAWVKFNTVSRKESIFSVGGDNELIIIKNTNGKLSVWIGGSEKIVESSITDTDWHHITLTRSGVNATLYRDGVSIGSSTSVTSGSISFGSCDLLIASDSDNGCIGSLDDYLYGQIDELRIWNDVRTASEISTNMSSELTGNESNLIGYYKFNEPDTNTVASNFASATGASYDGLLTNMAGTEWTTSTAFASAIETFTNGSGDDQWSTASNWASGSVPASSTNVSISSGQTISAGASLGNSIYFDGVNDYLSFSNTSDQFEASGDFTFEAWVKWSTLYTGQMSPIFGGQQHAYVSLYNGSKSIRIASNGTCSGDRNFGSSNTISTDEWHHISVVRSGSTITWYTDGISNGTTTCSAPWFGYGGTMFVGKNSWRGGYFHGYMKNIRYVDGTAVYTSNFTPPGTVSNITNTTFLMNVNSSSTYLTDTSSNGYTVTGHNGPTFTASNGPSGSGNSTTALANTIIIDSGGSLTIAKNSDLTLSGNFTNNGTVTLNSDADEFASIIVQGSSTGDIVYNRYVNTQGSAEWDLIGAPTDGLSISSFVTTNSTPLATSGAIYAVGVYDNSDDSWTNYTSSTVGAAGNFDIGRGYQMATSSGATMAFTGTVATTDQTQSIINNAGNGGRRWNLVANPYPSYLNANTNAHASNNFLSVNSGVIDSNFSAIYGYNADGSGYSIYNNTTAATYIAPGQAFFVAAASSSAANLSFTEAMQTTTGGDDFIAGRLANTSSELYLKLYEGKNLVGATKFYFDNNLSLGLDPGYDAGAYNQSSALASRLAEDDQGVNMGINAMGIDSFEQTTIPLVVYREAGTLFRISLEDLTIPESIEVYLEDTETQNFTNLRTEDFTLNPQSELSGMGRFYLRLGNTSLGGSDVEKSYISIYNPMDKDYITIEGLASIQKANVRLYNIIGQEILSKTLQTGLSTQNISTAGLTTGIYVIKLEVDSTLISKKIIIN